MVLCCSRHMFVRPTLRMDQRAWTEAHVEAFAFFGGVPRPACAGKMFRGTFSASVAARVMWPARPNSSVGAIMADWMAT